MVVFGPDRERELPYKAIRKANLTLVLSGLSSIRFMTLADGSPSEDLELLVERVRKHCDVEDAHRLTAKRLLDAAKQIDASSVRSAETREAASHADTLVRPASITIEASEAVSDVFSHLPQISPDLP